MITHETILLLKQWLSDYFRMSNGFDAILGMSGGKDSTVCAKLLVDTLGADRVIGVFMPNGIQSDIQDSYDAAAASGLTRTLTVNIADAYRDIAVRIPEFAGSEQANTNLAPRLRMTTLYAVAQSVRNGRVCCTGNRSEATVGYCTLWGDLAGDFAPLANITKSEVCEIGIMLGLPERLINKTPSDGLSGKSDEDKLGVTYAQIDTFIEWFDKGQPDDIDPETRSIYDIIMGKYMSSSFKRQIVNIPSFVRS